jgi:hypothetical protein
VRLTTNDFDATPRRLADGLYMFEGGYVFYVKDGVLYLGVDAVPPDVVVSCGRPLHAYDVSPGQSLYFMRGSDVMEVSPLVAQTVRAMAAKFHLDV